MIWGLLLVALAFAAVVPWGNRVIEALLKRGIGKTIRYDGPAAHQVKAGTATMGGVYILAGIAVVTVALAVLGYKQALLPLMAMLAFGALGAFDDLQNLRDRQGVGWLARSKFPWQWGVALLVALISFAAQPRPFLEVPLSGKVLPIGWWFVPLTMGTLVAFANAANLTDGLDGLAGGTMALAFGAYGLLLGVTGGDAGLVLFCCGMVGVLLAFLWYNVHPARVFMGDTGSQALGAGLAAVAMLSGHWLLLPIVGAVFVVETLSVMLQVGYFKYTRRRYGEGRRIFRMAPLHHHFEQLGMSEVQVTIRLWLVGAVAAAIGVGLGIGR